MNVEDAARTGDRCRRADKGRQTDLSFESTVHPAATTKTTPKGVAGRVRKGFDWGSGLAVVPGILAAMLPRMACPACWPAYAGLLGAAGLPVLLDAAWLLPLTAMSLIVALGALAHRARTRRGYAPLWMGTVAATAVLIGKFVVESDSATYVGSGLLVGASLWNAWPSPQLRQECQR